MPVPRHPNSNLVRPKLGKLCRQIGDGELPIRSSNSLLLMARHLVTGLLRHARTVRQHFERAPPSVGGDSSSSVTPTSWSRALNCEPILLRNLASAKPFHAHAVNLSRDDHGISGEHHVDGTPHRSSIVSSAPPPTFAPGARYALQ
jgi:hypothetical protein